MRKNFLLGLMLLALLGMNNIFAQDAAADAMAEDTTMSEDTTTSMEAAKPELSISVNPYAKAGFTVKGGKPFADHDDYDSAGVNFGADYGGISGATVNTSFDYSDRINASLDANAWIHVLKAFGVDTEMFDLYLKGGNFEAKVHSTQIGYDAFTPDIDSLNGDNDAPVMALDMKIANMITLKTALRLHDFSDGDNVTDLGIGLLVNPTFGDHSIAFSAGWSADLGDTSVAAPGPNNADYDKLGFALSYTGNFSGIMLKPYFNMALASVFTTDKNGANADMGIGWSGGVSFSYSADSVKYIGADVEVGGKVRGSVNYQAFQGLAVRLSTDITKMFMGQERYLDLWTKIEFGFDTPDATAVTTYESAAFRYFEFGLQQYLINSGDNKLSLTAAYLINNESPIKATSAAGTSYLDSDSKPSKEGVTHAIYLGLNASFKKSF